MHIRTIGMMTIRSAEKKYEHCGEEDVEKLDTFFLICDDIQKLFDEFGGDKVSFCVDHDLLIITTVELMYCELGRELTPPFARLCGASSNVTISSKDDVVSVVFNFPGIWKEAKN